MEVGTKRSDLSSYAPMELGKLQYTGRFGQSNTS